MEPVRVNEKGPPKLKVMAAQLFCGSASQFPDHWPELPACHIMTILKIHVLQVTIHVWKYIHYLRTQKRHNVFW